MSPSIRTILLASVMLAVVSFGSVVRATAPLTLTYETRVKIHLRLTYQQPAADPQVIEETLSGEAGKTLAFAHDLSRQGRPLVAATTFLVQPEEGTGRARLLFDSEVHTGGEPVRVKRDLTVDTGRLMLLDIWSDPERGERLLLSVAATWQRIPSLLPLRSGAEPVDLMLEVLKWDGETYHTLEKNRLGSLVGESVSYTFLRRPGLGENTAPTSRLVVDLAPESIEEGELFLRVRIRRDPSETDKNQPAVDTTLGQRLPPGFALDVPLPGPAGQPSLIFRITPYY